MDVVIVESPAKAKTINKYLGSGYTVLASYGHIRDLPPKDGSVDPDAEFHMLWQVDSKAEKHLTAISKALKGADHLFLATDPDREGEAISWHVRQVLEDRKVLKGIEVQRVVFHEVTKSAVLEALENPRDLDHGLIEAYLARRALDYLVGFTLSPVLWRKLPGSRSAGRVQSVSLRLICERESEIELFKPREYWSIDSEFKTASGEKLTAHLTNINGKKLDRYDLDGEAPAMDALARLKDGTGWKVTSIERRETSRSPQPPFTTSNLQQEASRKLGFTTSHTMRVAQKLYEGVALNGETVGLITYMRTDSVVMAQEAVSACRTMIGGTFGDQYVPEKPNVYRSKARNAQEAHEAIRPTDVNRDPKSVAEHLDADGRKLYELIWKRTVASAMTRAKLEQVAIDITDTGNNATLRATGSILLFDGFLKLYREDRDDPAEDDDNGDKILPKVAENEALDADKFTPEQHFTKPPPRYTEASLVRKMEELGIGRPSTYASIISVLQDRSYVRLEKKRFEPEDRGRVVTAFLSNYFERYVEYDFTSDLEDQLDGIARGEQNWKKVLGDFWTAFFEAVEGTKQLTITDVIDRLDAELGPHFFPVTDKSPEPRLCLSCKTGKLGIKLGRGGPFIGCSNYPECNYTRSLGVDNGEDEATASLILPLELGADPETELPVTLRKGPFGFYVQLGETPPKGSKTKEKPKRSAVTKTQSPAEVTLEIALRLLSLPREVGAHPETGKMISAGLGRYGPYLRYEGAYIKLGPDDDLLTIGLNRAVIVISEAPKRSANGVLRELGEHPEDGKPIRLYKGRYGPYVKHGKINASLPKSVSEDEITLDGAIELIAERAEKVGKDGKGAKAAKKPKKPKKVKKKTFARKPKKTAKAATSADSGA